MGNEDRGPYDYQEILASIAPRPLLDVAPTWDQYASFEDVKQVVNEAKDIYKLYSAEGKIEPEAPKFIAIFHLICRSRL